MAFLTASAESIWQRGVQPRTNEQFLLEYARKFGSTHKDIHRYFVQEQELLNELFSRSAMPKLRLDNDCPPEGVLEEAYQFWTAAPDEGSADSA